jgi:ATP-dependent RNA helicase RhlE
VEQRLIFVEQGRKRGVLANLLKSDGVTRALVFARTKHGADRVVKNLEADGIAANAIHGNKSQGQRERALADFKTGRAPVLVATDIAARGIDVEGVSHVIQYEMPDTAEAYVHRIGRTARAGASGIAIALCAPDEREKLWQVEKLIRTEIPSEEQRQDVSVAMRRQPGRPDAVKPAKAVQGRGGRGQSQGRGRPGGGRPQQPARERSAGAPQQPRGGAPSAPRGGDAPVRRPAAAASSGSGRDRSWREGDFRDGGVAPAFLKRR